MYQEKKTYKQPNLKEGVNMKNLLTCSEEDFHKELDLIDGACNGIALLNKMIIIMKELKSTDERNKCAEGGYYLQKLCFLNGIGTEEVYELACSRLILARKDHETNWTCKTIQGVIKG